MCCTTLIAQTTPMATTQLMRDTGYEICWPQREEGRTPFQPVRMNWVVVTDENGNRHLQMAWHADRGQ